MELFSDIYNCYYQVMRKILEKPYALSEKDLLELAGENGFEESALFIMPKILSGEWDFFERKNNLFLSKFANETGHHFNIPLSNLQKCYISALLLDEKIQLFFDVEEIERLKNLFKDYKPLWRPGDFYYYDRFADKDNFSDCGYKNIFRMILSAIKDRQWINFDYKRNGIIHKHYVYPCRLEYSLKNNRFRMLAVSSLDKPGQKIEIYNLGNICSMSLSGKYEKTAPDTSHIILKSYYKEPVRLIINDKRNALERTMLQFANYEKNTTRLEDGTYECCIYYNKDVETELLAEVLSFGPMVKVTGNEEFLEKVKMRLARQAELMKHVHNC